MAAPFRHALPELIAAARAGVMHYSQLRMLSEEVSRPATELLDELAYFVAKQYAAGQLEFKEADRMINAAWAACVSEDFWSDYDQTVPEKVREVYEAFDAGEYVHQGDSPDVDPEVRYTKPLIASFLASQNDDA